MNLQDLTSEDWVALGTFMRKRLLQWDQECLGILIYHYMNRSTEKHIHSESSVMHMVLKETFLYPFNRIPLLTTKSRGILGMPFAKLIFEFRLERGL